jgi:hypothetical protein
VPTTNATWPNRGIFSTDKGVLNSSSSTPNSYGITYPSITVLSDYSVEVDIRFPQAGTYGGGIFGRLSQSNGQRYAAWVYPGSATIKLIKFYEDWGSWNSPGFATASIPAVGSGWHHLKMSFSGNRIQVFYDGAPSPLIDVTDTNTDGHGLYTSGYSGMDFYASWNTFGPAYNNFVIRNSVGAVILSEDFGTDWVDPLSPWIPAMGAWTVADGVLKGISTPSTYANVYLDTIWTDYSVEGRLQFPVGALGGGIGGRVDPATGAHYAAWIYPDGSLGGSNVLKLIKFRSWTTWNGAPMIQVALPSVGTGWHTLKLAFDGNRIRVYYDGNLMMDVVDNNYDSRPAYLSGGVSVDTWTPSGYSGAYILTADDISVRSPVP